MLTKCVYAIFNIKPGIGCKDYISTDFMLKQLVANIIIVST